MRKLGSEQAYIFQTQDFKNRDESALNVVVCFYRRQKVSWGLLEFSGSHWVFFRSSVCLSALPFSCRDGRDHWHWLAAVFIYTRPLLERGGSGENGAKRRQASVIACLQAKRSFVYRSSSILGLNEQFKPRLSQCVKVERCCPLCLCLLLSKRLRGISRSANVQPQCECLCVFLGGWPRRRPSWEYSHCFCRRMMVGTTGQTSSFYCFIRARCLCGGKKKKEGK